ncbi:MAG TPA: hypothetical protein VG028_20335 [Terriglobia bacterium]|nr:hypothetical protein [Terriglobia bacterium]
MASQFDDRRAIVQERRVLQALCNRDPKVMESAGRLLAGYRWREPVHQIIFACLSGISAGGPLSLRERLAGCATRKGFPDVDWEEFFPVHPISSQEAEGRVRLLLDQEST